MSSPFPAHQWALIQLFDGTLRHKGQILVSIVITALAMSFLLVAFSLAASAYAPLQGLSAEQEITVFTTSTNSQQAEGLQKKIAARKGVTSARVVTPDEAMRLISGPGEGDVSFTNNPLPNIILAQLSTRLTRSESDAAVKFIEEQPGVDSVSYDSSWNDRISTIRRAFTEFGILAGGLLCSLILMVLIGSANLAVTTSPREASWLRLLGASPFFISRPDAWRGGFVFLIGSAAALLISDAAISRIGPSLASAFGLYHLPVSFGPLPLWLQLAIIAASTVLGAVLSGATSLLSSPGEG